MLQRGTGAGWLLGMAVSMTPTVWAIAQPFGNVGKQGSPQPADGNTLVHAQFGLDRAALTPGTDATLAILFDIDPGWHLYWKNPGDTGMGPEVTLHLPAGVTQTGPMRWPAPSRHPHDGFMVDNIYENQLTLLAPIHIAPDAKPGDDLVITAEVDWLVCADVCVPGSARLSMATPVVAPGALIGKSPFAQRIETANSLTPAPASRAQGLGVEARWKSGSLVIHAPGASALTFFHNEPRDAPPRNMVANGQRQGDTLVLHYPARAQRFAAITGVVVVNVNGKEKAVWINVAPHDGN